MKEIARKLFRSIFSVCTHTEYAGTGRVLALMFFRGAGRCIVIIRGRGRDGKPLAARHWPGIEVNGFTIYLRVAPTSYPSTYPQWRRRFSRVTMTGNANAVQLF